MTVKAFITIAISCALLAACHGQTAGSPSTTSQSTTPLAGVSEPTTSRPNPHVTSTTFDGCAVVTDAEAASWGVDPAEKHDAAEGKVVHYEDTRGCDWQGHKWDVRVYATNGTLKDFGEPDKAYEFKQQVQFGSRQGWVARDAAPYAGCSAFVPSQNGIAVVQLVGGIDVQDARTDLCPNAIEIMKTIEPRIP